MLILLNVYLLFYTPHRAYSRGGVEFIYTEWYNETMYRQYYHRVTVSPPESMPAKGMQGPPGSAVLPV